jgi:hypothetical protein
MKIKIYQVLGVLSIYEKVRELKVPAKVAYKFNKLCNALKNDADFYRVELNKIIERYGERDENGSLIPLEYGGVKIKSEDMPTAQKEINNLDNLEVDAPDIKFTVDELDGLQLSIEDFNRILPFIEE